MGRARSALGLVCLFALVLACSAKVYFKETFDDDWETRWVKSDKVSGSWDVTAGEWYGDAQEDRGLRTKDDARFYGISARMWEPFTNEDKTLVLQFSVKHPQKIDCGGGYIKLLPTNTDQKGFNGDSSYNIMFGPDICGSSTRRVHVIFNYKGQNKLIKKDVRCETDQLTHLYTLIVRPDNTYEVLVDQKKVESGSLFDDWDMLPPKRIKDPNARKPADWVDEAKIPDPTDKKPEGWDDTPAQIPDPEARKPDDWDDELDGEWEPPMIDNPAYKGEWKARMIDNPAYKGPWIHPEIDNPDYVHDDKLYLQRNMEYVGFDLWQVKSGTIFDNIIVTDSEAEAEEFANETFKKNKDQEKKMFDDIEAARKKQENEEREAHEKNSAAQSVPAGDDHDHDHDHGHGHDDDDADVPNRQAKFQADDHDLKDEL